MVEFGEIDSGNFDVQINAVDDWAGDFLLIFGNQAWRAGAMFVWVIVITAGAGILAGDESKSGREQQRALGAADSDGAVFERLAQVFENGARKLGEFVEE